MTKANLLSSIIFDLGANYRSDDETLLGVLLDEVINDALFISNRIELSKTDLEGQLDVLSSEIRKCTKSIYLQRGSEDVSSQSESGISSSFYNAKEILKNDIVSGGKRLVR